jgi:DNA-binding transcriptional regulator YdaS (Cro superfamily)
MSARKQALLRIEDVVRVLREEVRNVGGQAELARKTGVNRPNLNSAITGKRSPTNDILRTLNLRKAFAYEKAKARELPELLRLERVARILRDEVGRAGSQAEWARNYGVHGPSLSGTITGKTPPTKDILRALGLQKVLAYEKM